jgi:hypothetical protein
VRFSFPLPSSSSFVTDFLLSSLRLVPPSRSPSSAVTSPLRTSLSLPPSPLVLPHPPIFQHFSVFLHLLSQRPTTPALIYNGINSTIDLYRGNHHDVYGSMAAAAATGAIWRSTGAFSLPVFPFLLVAAVDVPPLFASSPSRLAGYATNSWRQIDGHHLRTPHRRRGGLELGQGAAPLSSLHLRSCPLRRSVDGVGGGRGRGARKMYYDLR